MLEAAPAFNRYSILDKIGEGGTGFVYRAIDRTTGLAVALKTARDRREGRLQSIRREIESLRQLRHFGIVRILDGGVVDGKPWYAMELLEGHTLWSRLRTLSLDSQSSNRDSSRGADAATLTMTLTPTLGGLPTFSRRESRNVSKVNGANGGVPADACGGQLHEYLTFFRQICAPLAYLHGEGYVHRDLKPSNVFIRVDGMPVLMDFGLALLLEKEVGRASLAVSANRAGTLGYMAPEQLRGDRVDARADLFALGCMMYEAVTGRLPFQADSAGELRALHASQFVQPPSSIVNAVPDELEQLILGMLAIKPRERVGHASHVAAVLEKLGAVGWPRAEDPSPRSYLYRPELNGRETFVRAGQRRLDRLVQTASGGILLVSGESGIGKTSALVEMARLTEERGIQTVTGECVAVPSGENGTVHRSAPLNAFRHFLMAVSDRCGARGSEGTRRLLGANLNVLAACVPELADLPGAAEMPLVPDLPAEASRRRLFEALAATIVSFAGRKPLVLIVDDFQWADDLSSAFLQFLPATFFQENAILAVIARGDEGNPHEIDGPATQPHVHGVRLEPLDQGAIRSMAEDMLAERELPESLVRFLFRESAGNPSVVSEYLRTAADRGFLLRNSIGRWRPANPGQDFQTLPVPGSLRDVLLSRLDGLSTDARYLMEVVAVLGRECDLTEVARVSPEILEDVFARSLHELHGREILVGTASGRTRFAHDRLREVAYQIMVPERRRVLHQRVAHLLEEIHPTANSRRVRAAELAHHFEQAGDIRRAAEYWHQAADVAHRAFANRETLSFIDKANDLDRAAGIRRDVIDLGRRERLRAEALQGMGESARALEGLLSSARLIGVPFPRTSAGVAARSAWDAFAEAGRRLIPRGAADVPEVAERARLIEASRVYQQLPSAFYYVTGDAKQVLCAALINLSLAERLGPSAELASAVAGIHISAGFVPLHGLADFYGRALRAMIEKVSDQAAVTWALINTSAYAMGTCRWDVVRADTEFVRRSARQMGFHRRWEEATAQLGTTLFMTGDLIGAARTFEELRTSAERGDNQTQLWALVGAAQIRLIQGDASTARDLLAAAERLLAKGLTRAEQIFALGPYAVSCLRMGDEDAALRVVEACADWIRKGGPIACYTVFAYSTAVAVFHELLRLHPEDLALADGFRGMVRELRRMAKVFPAARAFAAIWDAVELDRQGRAGQAIRRLESGRADARRHGLPLEEALAEAGLAAFSKGPFLERANEIGRRLGVRITWPPTLGLGPVDQV